MLYTPWRRFLMLATLLVLACASSLAYADGGAPAATVAGVPSSVALYGLIALVIAQVATALTKRLSTTYFFHTALGTLVLSAVSAALGSVGAVVAQKGPDKWALITAALNAVLNVLITYNTTNPTAVEAVRARRMRASGIGGGGHQAALFKATLFSLLVIFFLGAGAPTCSPGAQRLGACELQHLPQTLQTAIALVVAIAGDPAKTADDFITAGKDLGPGQLDCVVAAVADALKARVPSHGQADPQLVAMVAKLEQWRGKHPPVACAERLRF